MINILLNLLPLFNRNELIHFRIWVCLSAGIFEKIYLTGKNIDQAQTAPSGFSFSASVYISCFSMAKGKE